MRGGRVRLANAPLAYILLKEQASIKSLSLNSSGGRREGSHVLLTGLWSLTSTPASSLWHPFLPLKFFLYPGKRTTFCHFSWALSPILLLKDTSEELACAPGRLVMPKDSSLKLWKKTSCRRPQLQNFPQTTWHQTWEQTVRGLASCGILIFPLGYSVFLILLASIGKMKHEVWKTKNTKSDRLCENSVGRGRM